jgi:hypothetical protein
MVWTKANRRALARGDEPYPIFIQNNNNNHNNSRDDDDKKKDEDSQQQQLSTADDRLRLIQTEQEKLCQLELELDRQVCFL